MIAGKKSRLREVAKEFNVGTNTIIDFLGKRGIKIENNPNARIEEDVYVLLFKEYSSDINLKKELEKQHIQKQKAKPAVIKIEEDDDDDEDIKNIEEEDVIRITDFTLSKEEKFKPVEKEIREEYKKAEFKIVGKIDLEPKKKQKKEVEHKQKPSKQKEEKPKREDKLPADIETKEEIKTKLPDKKTPTVIGKIDLEPKKKTKTQDGKTEVTKLEKKSKKTEVKVEKTEVKPEKPTKEPEKLIIKPNKEKPVTIEEPVDNFIPSKIEPLTGPTILGKMNLGEKKKKTPALPPDKKKFAFTKPEYKKDYKSDFKKEYKSEQKQEFKPKQTSQPISQKPAQPTQPISKEEEAKRMERKRRKRIKIEKEKTDNQTKTQDNEFVQKKQFYQNNNQQNTYKNKPFGPKKKFFSKPEISEDDVSKQIKDT